MSILCPRPTVELGQLCLEVENTGFIITLPENDIEINEVNRLNIMHDSVECIHCDDDVDCYGHLTETEIIDVIGNDNSDIGIENVPEDEEDEEVDIVPSLKEALKALNIVQKYCFLSIDLPIDQIETEMLLFWAVKLNELTSLDLPAQNIVQKLDVQNQTCPFCSCPIKINLKKGTAKQPHGYSGYLAQLSYQAPQATLAAVLAPAIGNPTAPQAANPAALPATNPAAPPSANPAHF
ncbi:hypothetical protein FF38_05199 [Lucilia cuprina]|uniref:Uncharacterized protein n=1 Tax=Lucilia cuprina TaxID=7375 RepID=A0A0L0CNN9_LUCCU|nr:hypothetical protein FF38_05199 [Lucilia cuprina]